MKHFIIKTSLFLLIFFASLELISRLVIDPYYFFSINTYNVMPERQGFRDIFNLKPTEHVDYLFIGSSRVPATINPSLIMQQDRNKNAIVSGRGYMTEGIHYQALVNKLQKFPNYLKGAKEVFVEDPYIRSNHQIQNFLKFCELVVEIGTIKILNLSTSYEDEFQKKEAVEKFISLAESLLKFDIKFRYIFNQNMHDREIRVDNGWIIKIGRGFDYFQKPEDWYTIGASEMDLRPCLETKVDIFRASGTT